MLTLVTCKYSNDIDNNINTDINNDINNDINTDINNNLCNVADVVDVAKEARIEEICAFFSL